MQNRTGILTILLLSLSYLGLSQGSYLSYNSTSGGLGTLLSVENLPTGTDLEYEVEVELIYTKLDRTDVLGQNFELTIPYELYSSGNPLVSRGTGSLEIKHSSGDFSNGRSKDKYLLPANTDAVILTPGIVDAHGTVTPSDVELRLSVRPILSNNDQTTNYYDLDFIDYNDGEELLTWSYNEQAVEYEIEWLYLDWYKDYSSAPENVNWFEEYQGVSVRTKETHYHFTPTLPEGVVYFRVRPVLDFIDSETELLGDWHYQDESSNDVYLIIQENGGFEPGKSWSSQTIYAESGREKTVVSYVDALGNVRQSKVQMHSDKTVVVQEQFYDYEGRATMQVLPFPVAQGSLGNKEALSYMTNANVYSDGTKSKSNYDRRLGSLPMSTVSGASNYFSSLNQTEQTNKDYIPDAEGYVFSQTKLLEDATGRVTGISGVGSEFSFDKTEEENHTVGIYYLKPTKEELHRLFGSQIGDAVNYRKVVSVDPNKQASVAYIDIAGRTIATGLLGSNPDNLEKIESLEILEALAADPIAQTIENAEITTDGHIVATHQIGNFEGSQDVDFHYEFTGANGELETGLCLTCQYELEIYVTNPLGDRITLEVTQSPEIIPGEIVSTNTIIQSYTGEELMNDCTPWETDVYEFNATFGEAGIYTIVKDLQVIDTKTSDWVDYVTNNTVQIGLPSLDDITAEFTANTDYSQCITDCEERCEYVVGLEHTVGTAAYETALSDCRAEHCEGNFAELTSGLECDGMLLQMSRQFDNDGIYHTSSNGISLSDLEELLDEAGLYDPNESLLDLQGEEVNSNTYLWESAVFLEEWSEQLALAYHPEIGHYHYCKLTAHAHVGDDGGTPIYKNIDTYQELMLTQEEALVALERGYLDPLGINGDYQDYLEDEFIGSTVPDGSLDYLFSAIANEYGCDLPNSETDQVACDYFSNKLDDCNHLQSEAQTEFLNYEDRIEVTENDLPVIWEDLGIDGLSIWEFVSNEVLFEGKTEDEQWNLFAGNYNTIRTDYEEELKVCMGLHYEGTEDAVVKKDLPFSFSDDDIQEIIDNEVMTASTEVNQALSGYAAVTLKNQLLNECVEYIQLDENDILEAVEKETIDNTVTGYLQAYLAMTSTRNPHSLVLGEDLMTHPVLLDLQSYLTQENLCSLESIATYHAYQTICDNTQTNSSTRSTIIASIFNDLKAYFSDKPILEQGEWSDDLEEEGYPNGSLNPELDLNDGSSLSISLNERMEAVNLRFNSTQSRYLSHTVIRKEIERSNSDLKDYPFYIAYNGTERVGSLLSNYYPYIDSYPFILGIDENRSISTSVNITTSDKTIYTNLYADDYVDPNYNPSCVYVIREDCNCHEDFVAQLPGIDFSTTPVITISEGDHEALAGDIVTVLNEYIDIQKERVEYYYGVSAYTDEEFTFITSHSDLPQSYVDDYESDGIDVFYSSIDFSGGKWRISDYYSSLGGITQDYLEDIPVLNITNKPDHPMTRSDYTPTTLGSVIDGSINTSDFFATVFRSLSGGDIGFLMLNFDQIRLKEPFEYDATGFQVIVTNNLGEEVEYKVLANKQSNSNAVGIETCSNLGYSSVRLSDLSEFLQINKEDGSSFILDFYTQSGDLINPDLITEVSPLIYENREPDFTAPYATYTGTYSFMTYMDGNGEEQSDYIYLYSSDPNEVFFATCLGDVGDPVTITENECIADLEAGIDADAEVVYQDLLLPVIESKLFESQTDCKENVTENFTYTTSSQEYHHTLYYYDVVGNLVQTVPPAGVTYASNFIYDSEGNYTGEEPDHLLATQYSYNNLGQPVTQITPDGGKTQFWYDSKANIRLSQHADHIAESDASTSDNKYAYVKYDYLNRPVESGQLEELETEHAQALKTYIEHLGTEEDQKEALKDAYVLLDEPSFPGTKGNTDVIYNRTEVTLTYYTEEYTSLNVTQNHLRNRISCSVTREHITDSDNDAVVFSYDIHGNVTDMWQYMNAFGTTHVHYDYDLISGNVNKVSYQSGKKDQFYHKYKYDLDNRLVSVQTSNDDGYYQEDAHYYYYLHGPLARVELGEENVQGLDYYYTLQGWLKGINTPGSLGSDGSTAEDLGEDGISVGNRYVAKDEFAMTLGYFKGDFNGIGSTNRGLGSESSWSTSQLGGSLIGDQTGLYNGNISTMVHQVHRLGELKTDESGGQTIYGENYGVRGQSFVYDQLNRLTGAFSHQEITGNSFNTRNSDEAYDVHYSYDANGNIETLQRYGLVDGNTELIDNLTYAYQENGAGRLISNRLQSVNDIVGKKLDNDLKKTAGDYIYDKRGNLISDGYDDLGNKLPADVLDEEDVSGIKNIVWRLDGKVEEVELANGDKLYFGYNAFSQRVYKSKVAVDGKITQNLYARDASGNVLANYSTDYENGAFINYNLDEHVVYGSNRLGIRKTEAPLQVKDLTDVSGEYLAATDPNSSSDIQGEKLYELSNHLGNVMVVVSDIKVGKTTNGGTADYYQARVEAANDYYPFGWGIEERSYKSDRYRYGFNGMEKDDEMKGQGDSYDFGARLYDARIGRFLSLDPMMNEYSHQSPYLFAANSPVQYIDYNGEFAVPPPLMGAILGGITEIISQLGTSIFLKKKSWSWAFENLKIKDIVIEAGTGAFFGMLDGGLADFVAFMAKGRNRKLIRFGIEYVIDALKEALVSYMKAADDEDINHDAIIGGVLTEAGFGRFFPNLGRVKKELKHASKKMEKKARQMKSPNWASRSNKSQNKIKRDYDELSETISRKSKVLNVVRDVKGGSSKFVGDAIQEIIDDQNSNVLQLEPVILDNSSYNETRAEKRSQKRSGRKSAKARKKFDKLVKKGRKKSSGSRKTRFHDSKRGGE